MGHSLPVGNAALTSAVDEDANPGPSHLLQSDDDAAGTAGNSVIRKELDQRL